MKTFYEYLALEERVSHRRGEQWRVECARRRRTREERKMRKISFLINLALILLLVLTTAAVACTTAVSAYKNEGPNVLFELPMEDGLR